MWATTTFDKFPTFTSATSARTFTLPTTARRCGACGAAARWHCARTHHSAQGREKHEFKTKDALNMIGTATAFVDKLVAQQRQASEKAAARPELDYAHPEAWSKDDVATWLSSKGLKQGFVKNFVANDIDGSALADIDNDDLAGMGIKKEENQRKLLKSIRKLVRRACAACFVGAHRRQSPLTAPPPPRSSGNRAPKRLCCKTLCCEKSERCSVSKKSRRASRGATSCRVAPALSLVQATAADSA